MSTITFRGYSLFYDSWDIITKRVLSLTHSPGFKTVVTLNPQILSLCEQDEGLSDYLSDANLILPESQGLVWAIKKISGISIERRPGIELLHALFPKMDSVYLLGSTKAVVQELATTLESDYSQLKVLGARHGFFSDTEVLSIIQDIRSKSPQFVLVGMGAPYQERFLQRLSQLCEVGVGIGVGGSFDVLSGRKKRAPKWMQKKGVEWLYRGLTEPQRLLKWGYMPSFIMKTILNKEFET
tara:strand:- start:685 stop:1404 length:720 start_codon:yes stop_codon:yes gene_type:complete